MTPHDHHRAKSACPHKAGSNERIETMRLRGLLGLPLHMDGDNVEQIPITHDGGERSEWQAPIYRTPR